MILGVLFLLLLLAYAIYSCAKEKLIEPSKEEKELFSSEQKEKDHLLKGKATAEKERKMGKASTGKTIGTPIKNPLSLKKNYLEKNIKSPNSASNSTKLHSPISTEKDSKGADEIIVSVQNQVQDKEETQSTKASENSKPSSDMSKGNEPQIQVSKFDEVKISKSDTEFSIITLCTICNKPVRKFFPILIFHFQLEESETTENHIASKKHKSNKSLYFLNSTDETNCIIQTSNKIDDISAQ